MALATHPLKGSCFSFPYVPSLWSKLNHCVPAFHSVERKYRFISLTCRSCSSIGASLPLGPKSTSFKVSAFKNDQFDDSGNGRFSSSEPLKNDDIVSYLKHKNEESSAESSKVENDVLEATTRSLAIRNLFKSWLMLLRAPLQTQSADKNLEESSLEEKSETLHALVNEKGELLKAFWGYIWSLDATIRIPFLLFTPLYLAVNLVYGKTVSKELIPLWILGPLVVVLYVKMFRALCGLYVFLFNHTINVLKALPTNYLRVKNYLIHIQKHAADIKNTNYCEVMRRKMGGLQGWFIERYLDLIEFVWPFYSRTFRYMKRMHII